VGEELMWKNREELAQHTPKKLTHHTLKN